MFQLLRIQVEWSIVKKCKCVKAVSTLFISDYFSVCQQKYKKTDFGGPFGYWEALGGLYNIRKDTLKKLCVLLIDFVNY